MNRGLLITATGTDVGKTLVTTGLIRQCLARGIDAMVMKPVQTGACRDESGAWIAPDVETVCGGSGLRIAPEEFADVCPYVYEPACSPHLAARMAGEQISTDRIVAGARRLLERHGLLVVETAGGILVPLNDGQTTIDLAAALAMPVLLVGHSGLGTLNQVLLSLEAMRAKKLKVLGVVLNDRQPVPSGGRFIREDNIRAIEHYGQVRVLAGIPHLGDPPDLARLDEHLAPLKELI